MADLEARQQALAASQAAWESKQAEDRQAAAARDAKLDAIRAELTAQRERLEEQYRQFEERLGSLQSRESELEERGRALESNLAATAAAGPSLAEVSEPSAPAPPTNAPVDLAAILRKTGFQIDLENAEEQPAQKAEKKPATKEGVPGDGPARQAAVDISAPVTRERKPAAKGEDEVSIDDYMSRLLARSRGDSAPPPDPRATVFRTPAPAPPAAAPRPMPAAVAPAALPEASPPGQPGEIALRAVAPEKQIDLRAMRQLANLSANNALHKHESKQLSGNTRAKLLVTVVSALVGTSLLIIHFLPHAPAITIYGAVAAFAVTALWGVNYLTLMAKMASERFANMSRHLKTGEGPAEAVNAAEADSQKIAAAKAKPKEAKPADVKAAQVEQEVAS